MGKPLAPKEQDNIQKWSGAGLTPVRIHDKLRKARLAKRQPGPEGGASDGGGSERASERASPHAFII